MVKDYLSTKPGQLHHDDRDGTGRPFCRHSSNRAFHNDDIDPLIDQVGRKLGDEIIVAFRSSPINGNVTPLSIPGRLQTLAKSLCFVAIGRIPNEQHTDVPSRTLICARHLNETNDR